MTSLTRLKSQVFRSFVFLFSHISAFLRGMKKFFWHQLSEAFVFSCFRPLWSAFFVIMIKLTRCICLSPSSERFLLSQNENYIWQSPYWFCMNTRRRVFSFFFPSTWHLLSFDYTARVHLPFFFFLQKRCLWWFCFSEGYCTIRTFDDILVLLRFHSIWYEEEK